MKGGAKRSQANECALAVVGKWVEVRLIYLERMQARRRPTRRPTRLGGRKRKKKRDDARRPTTAKMSPKQNPTRRCLWRCGYPDPQRPAPHSPYSFARYTSKLQWRAVDRTELAACVEKAHVYCPKCVDFRHMPQNEVFRLYLFTHLAPTRVQPFQTLSLVCGRIAARSIELD